jgi:hypothetical protein
MEQGSPATVGAVVALLNRRYLEAGPRGDAVSRNHAMVCGTDRLSQLAWTTGTIVAGVS